MKRTSGKRWISLVLALCLCLLVGCGGKQTGYDPLKGVETRMITDSAGRQVEIPAEITRIAPSGSTAQMILMPVAYDLLVGLSSSPSTAQMSYFPEEMRDLPTFGQFYGSKANLNMESLIAAQPQLISTWATPRTASPRIWTDSEADGHPHHLHRSGSG